ncbi:MAG: PAS domain S-box protein [Ignavibacteriales bacterium]|nr:PAS domain S-box protein [Ignavibacteriales bacterium]
MKSKIIIIVTTLILIVIGFLLFELSNASKKEVFEKFCFERNVATRQLTNAVETYLKDQAQTVDLLTSFSSLQNSDMQQMAIDISKFYDHVKTENVKSISIYNEKGTIIFSTIKEYVGQNYAVSDFFQWALKKENKGKQLFYSLIQKPDNQKENNVNFRFLIVAPIYKEVKQPTLMYKYVGVVATTIDLEETISAFRPNVRPNSIREHVMVLDQNETILFHSEHPEMVMNNIRHQDETCMQCHISFKHVETIVTQKDGTTEYRLKEGPKKLASFSSFEYKNIAWTIVLIVPLEEAAGFFEKNLSMILLLVGVLIVTLLGSSSLIYSFNNRLKVKAEEEAKYWREKRELEDQIRESEEKFRSVAQSANDAIISTNNKGIIFGWNKGAEKMFGYLEAEITGEKLDIIIPKGYRERHINGINRIEQGGQHNIMGRTVELCGLHKNSKEFPLELSIAEWETPSGKFFTGIIRDITERKQAEKELLKLSHAVEQSPVSIIITDTIGNIEYSNPKVIEITGYKPEELLGKNPRILSSGEKPKSEYKTLWDTISSGKEWRGELHNKKKNGELYWESVSISPILNTKGEITHFLAVKEDITERKISEDRQMLITKILLILNRPNEWQQIINDILNEIKTFTNLEAIAIRLKEGEDYPYFVVNGFPSTFAEAGRFLCSRNPETEIILDSEGKLHMECICNNIISGHTNPSFPFFTNEGSFWTNCTSSLLAAKTEKEVQVSTRNCLGGEDYESLALIPLKSGEKVIGLLQFNDKRKDRFTLGMIQFFEKIGSTIGIAYKRMLAEKQTRESEERYRFIVEATNDVIYRLRYNSMKYDYINHAIEKLTGYSPDEINQIGFKNIVVKISKYHIENINTELIVSDREHGNTSEWQADYKVRTKDGKFIWLADHSYPWNDDAGNLIGSIGILGDITERKNAEEEVIKAKEKAEEMNRLKSCFLANMSHELRTPLIGILGFAEILKDELTDQNFKGPAELIFDSGTRLKETLNLILDLSKIESEAFELNLEELEITDYVSSLIKVFKKSAESKGLELKIITAEELLYSKLDKVLLDSIINNLLNNAIKYTQKGSVTVDIKKINDNNSSSDVEILVKDTGIGIAKENQLVIFEPFRQASEGWNRNFEGTGLGLTLVKKYVERMHGTITVESKIGVGSAFKVTFPIIKTEFKKIEKSIIIERELSKIIEIEKISKPLILYVEDDIVSQQVIRAMVINYYGIDCVEDGIEAIESVKKKKYDIILMDINLGGSLNGLEIAREIGKIPNYKTVPIIAVTAYAMVGDKEKMIEGGCTHYLSKPFSRSEMLALLKGAINTRNF